MDDARIRALHRALEGERPRLFDRDDAIARAAVSLVVRPTPEDLEVLLIERPHSDGDPWSGHMALPGGRSAPGEEDLDTAIRETLEEVGIDLLQEGMQIGRLDDVRPSRGGPQIAVAAFVFAVPATARLVPSPAEVAAAMWIPLAHLLDPASAAEHLHPLPEGGRLRFPAVTYRDRVIWGLTYRMLMQFLEIARTLDPGQPA